MTFRLTMHAGPSPPAEETPGIVVPSPPSPPGPAPSPPADQPPEEPAPPLRRCDVSRCSRAGACETASCVAGDPSEPAPTCPQGARCSEMPGASNDLCVYRPRPTTFTCYRAAGNCERDITCTGRSGECPVESDPDIKFKPSGAVCYKAAGKCEVDVACTGRSSQCPSERAPGLRFAPKTSICYRATGACEQDVTCTGTAASCPADSDAALRFRPAGTVCREANGNCGSVSTCSGRAPSCPFPENHGRTAHAFRCSDKIYCHGARKDSFKKHRDGKGWDIGGFKLGTGLETLDELDVSIAATTQSVDWVAPAGKGAPPPWGHRSSCTPNTCPSGGSPVEAVFVVCRCNIDRPNDPCNWTKYDFIAGPPEQGAPICPKKPYFDTLKG